LKNRAAGTAYDDATIREALERPLEVREKPEIRRVDPRSIPSMADRGFRAVPSQPKRRGFELPE